MSDTRQTILDTAQELVQTRGYNGFSFRRLADAVGIKSASVHYHFPTKGDLGRALLARFRSQFRETCAHIQTEVEKPRLKLERYVEAFTGPLQQAERSCLGAMLAAEAETLPEAVRQEVQHFVDDQEGWLTRVLAEGREAGEFSFAGTPERKAKAMFAALEGASVLARATGDGRRLRAVARSVTEEV